MKKRYAVMAALALASFSALPSHGALVISEVLYNEVSSDSAGEWIEIYNGGTTTIDLSNYKIGDEETSGGSSTTEALYQFPAGASIAPGEVQVISAGATRFHTVYGVWPTYEAASTDDGVPDMTVYSAWDPDGGIINMSNSNDQAVLVDDTDTVIDAVSWGNTFAFNPSLTASVSDGQSYERINALIDTDSAADWQLGPTSTVAAERSTPFVVSVPEPASVGLAGLAGLGLAARRRNRR